MTYKKKLIEVAMPLAIINDASAYDKMPGIGPHPKGIHQWWARLPLPCARAVLFASLVDDPSCDPEFMGKTEKEQEQERNRLFRIIRALSQKKATQSPEVFDAAYAEIFRSCNGEIPKVVDPFCGGGSIPLEAQRLGLQAYGSDLNPVAVLISKAALEIVPQFSGCRPVHPNAREALAHSGTWQGATGLAEDVRLYGEWVFQEAKKRIGHLYPKIQLPQDHGGGEANVLAWVWARTVKCPNPACGASMPLVTTFALCSKKNRKAWVVPEVNYDNKKISFRVEVGDGVPPPATKAGNQRTDFRCLVCGQVAKSDHIKSEGQHHRIGNQLMAVVAEGRRGRVYLSPTLEHEEIAIQELPESIVEQSLPEKALGFRVQAYGMKKWADLYTNRQNVALTTFCDIVGGIREKVRIDCSEVSSGRNTEAYSDAVATFLAFTIDRCADFNNDLCRWSPSNEKVMNLFGRQTIPMIWDFAEANMMIDTVGGWITCCNYIAECIISIYTTTRSMGHIEQLSATQIDFGSRSILASTDPPYYNAIGYADLSDFFYVRLRKTLSNVYPELFGTMLTPKSQELVADPERYDGNVGAKQHFEQGFRDVFTNIKGQLDPRFPMTVYYAFKQTDGEDEVSDTEEVTTGDETISGWETLLEAIISSGFQITGTWPVRASQQWRMRSMGSNALASYIVLVCRPRPDNAPIATKREFVNSLRRELEEALLVMMQDSIAPVDLAQATIGPGMAVYSRYAKVAETDGTALRIRTALKIINKELDEILSASETDYDPETRFCIGWFEQFGMESGPFGAAMTLATARGTTPGAAVQSGVLEAKSGNVRLLKREEYAVDWNPSLDSKKPTWECTQYLVRALIGQGGGEERAARLCAALGSVAESARDLAYRLFSICEKKGWAQEAFAYNSLVISWPEITQLASSPNIVQPTTSLFAEGEV